MLTRAFPSDYVADYEVRPLNSLEPAPSTALISRTYRTPSRPRSFARSTLASSRATRTTISSCRQRSRRQALTRFLYRGKSLELRWVSFFDSHVSKGTLTLYLSKTQTYVPAWLNAPHLRCLGTFSPLRLSSFLPVLNFRFGLSLAVQLGGSLIVSVIVRNRLSLTFSRFVSRSFSRIGRLLAVGGRSSSLLSVFYTLCEPLVTGLATRCIFTIF
jgi:hypothetical protein